MTRALDALVDVHVFGKVEGVDFGTWTEHDWRAPDDDDEAECGEVIDYGYGEYGHCYDEVRRVCDRCYVKDSECHPVTFPGGVCMTIGNRPFSSDIAAAWTVVEAMKRGRNETWRFYFTNQESHDRADCQAVFRRGEWAAIANAATAPLAICLATLRAVGVPDDEIQAAMGGEA